MKCDFFAASPLCSLSLDAFLRIFAHSTRWHCLLWVAIPLRCVCLCARRSRWDEKGTGNSHFLLFPFGECRRSSEMPTHSHSVIQHIWLLLEWHPPTFHPQGHPFNPNLPQYETKNFSIFPTWRKSSLPIVDSRIIVDFIPSEFCSFALVRARYGSRRLPIQMIVVIWAIHRSYLGSNWINHASDPNRRAQKNEEKKMYRHTTKPSRIESH